MRSRFRRGVTFLLVSFLLSSLASPPALALTSGETATPEPTGPTPAPPAAIPRISLVDLGTAPSDSRMAGILENSMRLDRVSYQAAPGAERPRMSAAKKTWIVVGIVVGAAALVTVLSNRSDNDGSGGGGGGGY